MKEPDSTSPQKNNNPDSAEFSGEIKHINVTDGWQVLTQTEQVTLQKAHSPL